MKKMLIVDVRLIAYNTYHGHNSILNIINIIYKYTKDYGKFNKIIFAWDNKGGSRRRKDLFKGYKAHRRKKEKEQSLAEQSRLKKFNKDLEEMKDILKYLGTNIDIFGLEADDIANIFVEKYHKDFEIYLLSSDKDWAWNLQYEVKQISLTKGLITDRTCKLHFELDSVDILKFQFFAGMPKENVKGINKLGIKRFAKLLEKCKEEHGICFDKTLIDTLQEYIDTKKFGMALPEGFKTVKELYTFNKEVLREFRLSDLTDDELAILISQLNPKDKKEADELERLIISKFNDVYLFSEDMRKFYNLS